MTEALRVFPTDSKIDVILPDGTHRYWSTHCRHGHHELCSASEIVGVGGSTVRGVRRQRIYLTTPVTIARQPAQCKTCASPCICPCHKSSTKEEGDRG